MGNPQIPYKTGYKFPDTKLSYVSEEPIHINANGYKTRIAKFLCECGNYHISRIKNVKNGNCTSCGCATRVSSEKTKVARLKGIYGNMKHRCYNTKDSSYHEYGGRGIIICDEWLSDYTIFEDWALANGYEEHLTLERESNKGNYCPDNCTWQPMKLDDLKEGQHLQNWNTTVVNTVVIDGATYPSISEAHRQTGIARTTICKRCDDPTIENYSRELTNP